MCAERDREPGGMSYCAVLRGLGGRQQKSDNSGGYSSSRRLLGWRVAVMAPAGELRAEQFRNGSSYPDKYFRVNWNVHGRQILGKTRI
jgi:hypothetical protein